MIYIIAGRYIEAVEYARANKIRMNEWKYVYDFTKLIDISLDQDEIVVTGTWVENDLAIQAFEHLLKQPVWRYIIKRKYAELYDTWTTKIGYDLGS